ncbi:MAG: hypothetical protein K2N82_12840 [Lachnospiraceae bacterium]|nr:hypothetical protein [Lachnospiraceae bacterium]
MKRQNILPVLLLSFAVCGGILVLGGIGQTHCYTHSNSFSNKMDNSLLAVRGIIHKYIVAGRDNKMEAKTGETGKGYAPTGEYCNMEDLGEMDYYLLCNTDLHKGATGLEAKPSIISNDTQTIEETKELYQKFKEQLPLEDDSDEDERTEVIYISPDCKWVITEKWSEFQLVNTMTLFFQKEKVKEKTGSITEGLAEILIIKDGDTYKEAEEQYYKRLSELKKEMESEGYFILMKRNTEGDLIAGIKDNFSLLTIKRIEDGADQWSFDLQGMQEKVKKIRDDIREEDNGVVFVEQFRGNEQEGWLVIQVGPSSFFRIDYPAGEVTYLGEYLYSPSFSPDGKYMAYSSIDGNNSIDMDPAEYEQTPSPGIYVMEVETGKTAYIYWYPSRKTGEDYMESRGFVWLEKGAFEEYMGYTVSKE